MPTFGDLKHTRLESGRFTAVVHDPRGAGKMFVRNPEKNFVGQIRKLDRRAPSQLVASRQDNAELALGDFAPVQCGCFRLERQAYETNVQFARAERFALLACT